MKVANYRMFFYIWMSYMHKSLILAFCTIHMIVTSVQYMYNRHQFHARYMYNSHQFHVKYMYNSHQFQVRYMYNSHQFHVQYMYNSHYIHVQYMYNSHQFHVQYMYNSHQFHVAIIKQTEHPRYSYTMTFSHQSQIILNWPQI